MSRTGRTWPEGRSGGRPRRSASTGIEQCRPGRGDRRDARRRARARHTDAGRGGQARDPRLGARRGPRRLRAALRRGGQRTMRLGRGGDGHAPEARGQHVGRWPSRRARPRRSPSPRRWASIPTWVFEALEGGALDLPYFRMKGKIDARRRVPRVVRARPRRQGRAAGGRGGRAPRRRPADGPAPIAERFARGRRRPVTATRTWPSTYRLSRPRLNATGAAPARSTAASRAVRASSPVIPEPRSRSIAVERTWPMMTLIDRPGSSCSSLGRLHGGLEREPPGGGVALGVLELVAELEHGVAEQRHGVGQLGRRRAVATDRAERAAGQHARVAHRVVHLLGGLGVERARARACARAGGAG